MHDVSKWKFITHSESKLEKMEGQKKAEMGRLFLRLGEIALEKRRIINYSL